MRACQVVFTERYALEPNQREGGMRGVLHKSIAEPISFERDSGRRATDNFDA